MSKIQINFPEFLKEAFFNSVKYTCVAAGRRTGKTYNAFQWQLIELLMKPSLAGLWVDTTQRNLTEYVEIYVKKILGGLWSSVHYDKQGHKLTLPNNSFLHMRSAERPENMEGFEYDKIVCNEAGIIFKGSELWTNTIMPMAKNAQVKFVGTPKGKNYFYQLFQASDTSEDWQSYQFSAYSSPYWQAGQLDAIRSDPSMNDDIWRQEYLGEFIATTSNLICKSTHKLSWRDEDDKAYTFDHQFIQKQIRDEGYFFLTFDGGMYTTHSAALLGFYNQRFRRRIYLKEFYNRSPHEDVRAVALQAKDFLEHHQIVIQKIHGDPALKTYGDDDKIASVFNIFVDCLEWMRKSDNSQIKTSYTDRKTKRLGRLSTEANTLKSDQKPAIILLKDNKSDKALEFGCPKLYAGIFDGQFRYDVKDGVISKDIEQIPPITDICDAASYEILSTSPISLVEKHEEKEKENRLIYNQARLGW